MYSMVLMAALTSGGTTPDCHFRGGCSGCYGGCYGGGWGGGCHGCHGGYYGNCYGSCYGNCYGGWGSGYGCAGSCWGGSASAGCWGASYGCYGCYGGGFGYGPGYYGSGWETMTPGGVAPSYMPGATMPPASGETLPKPKADGKDGTSLAPNRARLIVELPADAKLYIDDQAMKTTSGRRTFHTPDLKDGQTYYYMLRAEVVRDGKPLSEERRVILRAGDVVRTDFTALSPAVSTASAR
jgi:uncharacterized protein (TIGR03000 family)